MECGRLLALLLWRPGGGHLARQPLDNQNWRRLRLSPLPPPRPTRLTMLSRVANSLYWMSRYIERAENIARIVDVNLQLLLDFRGLNEQRLAEHWLPIVQTTGDEKQFFGLHKKATAQRVTEFLVFQAENPNSIVSAVCQARENARMVRDQITHELWEELNRLYWFVKTPQARQAWKASPTEFFQQIKAGS